MTPRAWTAAAAALIIVACDDQTGGYTKGGLPAPVDAAEIANEPVVVEPASGPGHYVRNAATNATFLHDAAILALEKSQDPQMRQFAESAVETHRVTLDTLARAAAGVSPPVAFDTGLAPEQQQKLTQLQQASGDEFRRLYLDAVVDTQARMLALRQDYANTGDAQPLAQHARETLPMIEQHLQQARALMQGG